MSDFNSLNFHPSILEELKKKGYKKPTPIQSQSIEHIGLGKDLLGIAQTGTGKTAAFSLPLINKFANDKKVLKERQVRALIITPTRELATQIDNNIKTYAKGLSLKTEVLIGGVRKEPQIDSLKPGVDFIVATPGRLMDLMRGDHIKFDQLEAFVLDEADMMLDMGFLQDVETITKELPENRQTILFSATMPKAIEVLANNILSMPIKIEVTPESSTIEKIKQQIFFVEEINKLYLLTSILEDVSLKRVLIFCKAKYGVANVVEQLNKASISVGEIHSNKSQLEREKALSEFTEGRLRVLVATDIAARGIDVSEVSHVINFNMPEDATNYVHRIGRTARAGREGMAISLCGEKDLPLLRNVEKLIKLNIPKKLDHPFHKEFEMPVKKSKSKSRNQKRRKR